MLGPLTRALVGVPVKMLGLLLDIANRLGRPEDDIEFFNDLAKFVREWRKKVVETTKEVKTYLRHLFTLKLGATSGKDTYSTARKVFRGYFAPEFESFGIVFSGVAPETEVAADELVRNGQFTEFLGNTAEELEKFRLLGSQFLSLCLDDSDKLQRNGYANFFVLTRGDEVVTEDLSNVFVARVGVDDDGGLRAGLCHVSGGYIWSSGLRHRIFSPQQALVSSESA